MITTAIINLGFSVISSFIGFFPVGSGFSSEFHSSISFLGQYARLDMLSPLIPIGSLYTAMILLFGIEIVVFGFKTLKWIISHLPWIGGRG